MTIEGQSQILKADMRYRNENHLYRCLSTFNFGNYEDDSRNPFGCLAVFNEETLASKHSISFLLSENQSVLLLPLVGEISVTLDGIEHFIRPEETLLLSSDENSQFEIKNSSEDKLANYLQVRFKNSGNDAGTSLRNKFGFLSPNTLVPILKKANISCFIGFYQGRNSENYTLKNKENGIFAYVIQGAFEFQDRLLESGDGLRLEGFLSIAFEALSENAILLFMEIPL